MYARSRKPTSRGSNLAITLFFFPQAKKSYTFLNEWKNQEKYTLWYMEIIWNSNFSFTGRQPYAFVHILPMVVFEPYEKLSSWIRDCMLCFHGFTVLLHVLQNHYDTLITQCCLECLALVRHSILFYLL